MPIIERRNILDLIGKHRGKYHSCILTCYSLDFSFFEERVLPVLRTANIKNVNILADGKFLEQAQETTTGMEFRFNKTYNFQPVYATGVFHPKIMFLSGLKHGLLIIGSGNITSSGLSTNDEIWAAFHLENLQNENAPVFAAVWNYLQQYLNESYGFLPQKIEWIKKYSPWIAELPQDNGDIKLDSLNLSLSFISNSGNASIFQQLLKKIPKDGVESITVISPYYDKRGVVLNELYTYYNPETFNCIVDIDYGLIPHDLEEGILNNIDFYDWKTCKKDHLPQFNRLHAKMIHFQFKHGLEYMFFGSANATDAGMGTNNKRAVNEESGLIISRTSDNSWLQELKIKIPKESIDLSSVVQQLPFDNQSVPKSKHKLKIVYTELRGIELSVFTKEEVNNIPGKIQVLSRYSLPIENLQFTITGNKLTAKCKNPEDVFKVCITDDTGQVISNFSIVHRFEALLKCNPDPDQEKLDSLLEQDYPDGEGVTELLTFIDHNWADEEERNEAGFSQSGYGKKPNEKKIEEREHEILPAVEFNKISDEMLLKQAGELSGSNVKIAEFLSLISAGIDTKTDAEYKESEEQKLLEDGEQKGEGEEVTNKVKPKSSGRKEKMAISRYFKKLRKHYNKRLNSFYETKALTVTPDEKMTIKVLSNILIALQLIQIYYGKKYSIVTGHEDLEESETIEESYLKEGDLFSDCDSIKGFMVDVFGKFLLLSTAGMNLYDYEILNEKISFNRKQILIKAIFTTLNMTWKQSEIGYRDTILLNALYFITPDPENEYFLAVELKGKIEEYKLNAKTVSSHFNDNFSYLFEKLIPRFVNWLNLFRDNSKKEQVITDTSEIKNGSIIFNSKIGFNLIYKSENSLQNPRIDFLRAGFEWNEEEEASLWEDITFTKKCVAFSL